MFFEIGTKQVICSDHYFTRGTQLTMRKKYHKAAQPEKLLIEAGDLRASRCHSKCTLGRQGLPGRLAPATVKIHYKAVRHNAHKTSLVVAHHTRSSHYWRCLTQPRVSQS